MLNSCVVIDEGLTIQLSNFGMYQRLFSVYDGPLPARIVVTAPRDGALTYGWWWSRDEAEPREQSRAEVHRTG